MTKVYDCATNLVRGLAARKGSVVSRDFWKSAEDLLGHFVEWVASLLIVAEVIVLLLGILGRLSGIVLGWTDELASLLFLWLAMLGAVVALRRGKHMRMTAFVNKAGTAAREYLDAIALVGGFAVLLCLLEPAFEYASEEAFITTPALQIQNSWGAAAMPVGIGLMIVISLFRLFALHNVKSVGGALVGVALAAVGFYSLRPYLHELGNYNLLIFFAGCLSVTVLSGIPIAFSFGLATLGYVACGTDTPVLVLIGRMDEGMSQIILLAVPLFVFLGLLIEMTGMARAMVVFLASLLGHIRGGLSYVLIGAMYLVSGISGSKAADMAAVAPILFPEMLRRGAKPGDLVALLAATGAQTETVPPSLVLITIGSATGVSIAGLFTGGMLPGVVLAAMLCFVVWYRYRHEDMSKVRRATLGDIGKAFRIGLPALVLPFVIRIAVVRGIATATEVSTLAIVYSMFVGILIYRQFDWKQLGPMLIDTASLSGAILLIIGCATGMAWSLTQSGFSTSLAEMMIGLPGGSYTFLAASIIAFVILGSVLEGIPAVVLFGPLLFPIAGKVGINEIHYAMVVVLAMGIGLFAPPFGVGYYTTCVIGRVSPDLGIRPIVGYLTSALVGIVIVALFPWISTCFL
jgi:tripartite ATP-independent transporter DctM subunit